MPSSRLLASAQKGYALLEVLEDIANPPSVLAGKSAERCSESQSQSFLMTAPLQPALVHAGAQIVQPLNFGGFGYLG